eukprot:TRINITY_DN55343_c0_g1_i2.p1 TRINITY_DN55343_c0_g1~~TRINITY_DN55343_c0_g1_i2.p1  ORF type:complete len:225 (+),score=29.40 TRINITY_DN55343_c0_g1_i2:245-919(+)
MDSLSMSRTVTYKDVDDLKGDMAMLDPATLAIRITLPGKGIPAGWQLKDMSKRQLGVILEAAYKQWPGEVCLTFEPPAERDECSGLSPRLHRVVQLCNAAYAGDISTANALLDAQVDVDAKVKTKGNNTALNFAARGNHTSVLQLLLSRHADVDARNDFSETSLMNAANRANLEACRVLIEAGADVNALDENGDNALSFVGVGGASRKAEVRQLLRQAGCASLT